MMCNLVKCPRGEPRIGQQLKHSFIASLSADLKVAQQQRNDVVLRRLNRIEYENSVRDVFGIDVLVKDALPQDSSTDGFDTVGEGLAISAEAMGAYLDAADAVIDSVFGPEKPLGFIDHVTNLNDQRDHLGNLNDRQFGRMFRKTGWSGHFSVKLLPDKPREFCEVASTRWNLSRHDPRASDSK